MEMSDLGRLLLLLALLLGLAGLLLLAGSALGLGPLPGDLSFRWGRTRVHLPVVSSLLISVVASVLLSLLLRR